MIKKYKIVKNFYIFLLIQNIKKWIIYNYSNYCKHSKKVLDFLSKSGLTEKLNCICIDKRKRNPSTNQTFVVLDDGKQVLFTTPIYNPSQLYY